MFFASRNRIINKLFKFTIDLSCLTGLIRKIQSDEDYFFFFMYIKRWYSRNKLWNVKRHAWHCKKWNTPSTWIERIYISRCFQVSEVTYGRCLFLSNFIWQVKHGPADRLNLKNEIFFFIVAGSYVAQCSPSLRAPLIKDAATVLKIRYTFWKCSETQPRSTLGIADWWPKEVSNQRASYGERERERESGKKIKK